MLLWMVLGWKVCDVVNEWDARGDGETMDTVSMKNALDACDEVVIPAYSRVRSGPLNLTSNQRERMHFLFCPPSTFALVLIVALGLTVHGTLVVIPLVPP